MTQQIKLVVGLGNPGEKYADTRHNVGFWFVDYLADEYRESFRTETKFQGEATRINTSVGDCWLLKPSTFMNASGRAVSAIAKFYKIPVESILVVHDELDLPVGKMRLKKGGGHGGHNGLRDISSAMGKDFYRLRIGIDHPGHKDAVSGYVLSRPGKSEQQSVEAGIEEAARYWLDIQAGQWDAAMNKLHTAT